MLDDSLRIRESQLPSSITRQKTYMRLALPLPLLLEGGVAQPTPLSGALTIETKTNLPLAS